MKQIRQNSWPWVLVLAILQCGLAGCQAQPTPDPLFPPTPVTQNIDLTHSIDGSGGTLTLGDGMQVGLPAGAISSAGSLHVQRLGPESGEDANPVYEITLEGGSLEKPALITLPVPAGIDPELYDIAVYHYIDKEEQLIDPATGQRMDPHWEKLDSQVQNGSVSAWTDSFSKFKTGSIYRNAAVVAEFATGSAYEGGAHAARVTGTYCTGSSQINYNIKAKAELKAEDFPLDVTLDRQETSIDFSEGTGCKDFAINLSADLSGQLDDPNILDIHSNKNIKLYAVVKFNQLTEDGLFDDWVSAGEWTSDHLRVDISGRARVTLTPQRGAPLDAVLVQGDGFQPGEDVALSLAYDSQNTVSLVTTRADERGVIGDNFFVPAEAGETWGYEYTLIATGKTSGYVAYAGLQVAEPKYPPPDPSGLSLRVSPESGYQGETFHVAGAGFTAPGELPGSDGVRVRVLLREPGTGSSILDETMQANLNGEIEFSIGSNTSMKTGTYQLSLTSEVDPSLVISRSFELTINPGTRCLFFSQVSGDPPDRMVLSQVDAVPVISRFLVKDACGRAAPARWQIMVQGLSGLAQAVLQPVSQDQAYLDVTVDAAAVFAGNYTGAVGLAYPDQGQPNWLHFQVAVTPVEYVVPQYIEETTQIVYKFGKDGVVDEAFECRRTDQGMVGSHERYLTIEVIQTCDPGHEDFGEAFFSVIDRFTGSVVQTTCTNCYSSPGPRPDAADTQVVSAGGQNNITAYTEQAQTTTVSSVSTETTQGEWEKIWNCERYFDTITGKSLGQICDYTKFFTGTVNGRSINRAGYGYFGWSSDWLVSTNRTLGVRRTYPPPEQRPPVPPQPPTPPRPPVDCTILMPAVTGLSLQDAVDRLKAAGYGYYWEDQHAGADQAGLIIQQQPEAGKCAPPRATIVRLVRNVGQ